MVAQEVNLVKNPSEFIKICLPDSLFIAAITKVPKRVLLPRLKLALLLKCSTAEWTMWLNIVDNEPGWFQVVLMIYRPVAQSARVEPGVFMWIKILERFFAKEEISAVDCFPIGEISLCAIMLLGILIMIKNPFRMAVCCNVYRVCNLVLVSWRKCICNPLWRC